MVKTVENIPAKKVIELIELHNIRSLYVMVNSEKGKMCFAVERGQITAELNYLNNDNVRVEYSLYKPYVSLCILNYNINVD